METYTYPDLYNRLNLETLILIFYKGNGEIRVMLGTRNNITLDIAGNDLNYELHGIDNRCSINNGNIGVIDLELGEARSFKPERTVQVYSVGIVDTPELLKTTLEKFKEFKEQYKMAIKE